MFTGHGPHRGCVQHHICQQDRVHFNSILVQGLEEATRISALLDEIKHGRNGQGCGGKSSLGCSDHGMMEFRIQCGRSRTKKKGHSSGFQLNNSASSGICLEESHRIRPCTKGNSRHMVEIQGWYLRIISSKLKKGQSQKEENLGKAVENLGSDIKRSTRGGSRIRQPGKRYGLTEGMGLKKPNPTWNWIEWGVWRATRKASQVHQQQEEDWGKCVWCTW